MRPLRLLFLLGALAAPAFAQTTYVAPAKPGSPEVATQGSLEVARNGDEVVLTWTLPQGEFRLIEIYRNSESDAKGRGRVGTARTTAKTWTDKLPDASAPYWYWLKLTREDGAYVNIGPVATPSGKIWVP